MLPQYPHYKPSGIRWLGEVPHHWIVSPVKYVAEIVNGYPFDSANFSPVSGTPLIRIRDLNKEDAEAFYQGEFVKSAAITSKDVLIGMDGDFNVGRWRGNGPALLNQRMCCVRGASDLMTRYLEYALPFPLKEINDLTYSTTVKHLSSGQIEKIIVARPIDEGELLAVLKFLDRETAKIDTLMAEQEKLIELLKEKRQAVISHAVTKGLDPKAPMKDSGVDWLGIVPEHWHVSAVSYRYEVQLGKMLDSSKVTGKHLRPYLRVLDVQWGEINTIDLPQMDFDEADRQKFLLQPGDLLVNEGGSYVGRSAVWSGVLDECYFQKALHRLRAANPKKDSSSFFLYVMEFATKLGVFVAGGNQTTIDHLTAESLRRYRFAFPPYQEQLKIAQFLKKECNKYDLLIRSASDAIILLSEKRSALISAAVTGKIDVRGFVVTEAA